MASQSHSLQGPSQGHAYPRRENRGIQMFKYAVVIESVPSPNGGFPQNDVTVLKLDDEKHFPSNNSRIVPPALRQLWQKGEMIFVNWPADKNNRFMQGIVNIVSVTVHGLYLDHVSARKAADTLIHEYRALSREREQQLSAINDAENEMPDSDGDGNLSNGNGNLSDENGNLSDGGDNLSDFFGENDDQASAPPVKRRKTKKSTAAASLEGQLDEGASALLRQILETVKNEQQKSDARDIKTEAVVQEIKQLKRLLTDVSRKQQTSSRKITNVSRLITGKVPATTPTDISVNMLFDEESPIIYMGIDRTQEINHLFNTMRGQEDKDFVKMLGKLFYGDDLYFYMFKSSKSGNKAGDRKPISQRDPEGVQLIEKIMKQYWELCVWPCNVENVKKSAEIDSSPANAAKLRGDLAALKQLEESKWLPGAFEWCNDWGTEARRRTLEFHFWTDSLFGRSVSDPRASKPQGYDEDSDNEWRRKLFSVRRTEKRTLDSFIPT